MSASQNESIHVWYDQPAPDAGGYAGPERRSNDPVRDRQMDYIASWLQRIDGRLDNGNVRMDLIQAEQKAMRVELTANTATTTEVRNLMAVAKTGYKVASTLGAVVSWLVKVGSAVGIPLWIGWYAMTNGGNLPPPPKP